jgi:hypothetical protein
MEAIPGFGIRDELLPDLPAPAQGFCISNYPYAVSTAQTFRCNELVALARAELRNIDELAFARISSSL